MSETVIINVSTLIHVQYVNYVCLVHVYSKYITITNNFLTLHQAKNSLHNVIIKLYIFGMTIIIIASTSGISLSSSRKDHEATLLL